MQAYRNDKVEDWLDQRPSPPEYSLECDMFAQDLTMNPIEQERDNTSKSNCKKHIPTREYVPPIVVETYGV